MNGTTSIGDMVTASPAAAKVFHKYGLDYCCGGSQTLDKACSGKGLDAEALLAEIKSAEVVSKPRIQWGDQPLNELIDYILETYHKPLKTELPRLVELAQKVERAHDDKPDVPKGLTAHLTGIREAVNDHLDREEDDLFPLIVTGRGSDVKLHIEDMIQEHEDHGENLRLTREIAGDFNLPEYACGTWRELYRSLDQLEKDLMDHVRLENNILFPRALAQ